MHDSPLLELSSIVTWYGVLTGLDVCDSILPAVVESRAAVSVGLGGVQTSVSPSLLT